MGATDHSGVALYGCERDLVDEFLYRLTLDSPWGSVTSGAEFFYHRGKTDIVSVDESGQVIAFEAKISKWREALQQAYRNTCFAHRSYVLLPKHAALRALEFSAEFQLRGVGICYVDDAITILHDACEVHPLQPWLSRMAAQHATECSS